MSALDFINHLINFAASAAFLAVVLALGARLAWRGHAHVLPWPWMAAINFLLGLLVLALGLVLTDHDGRMGTYAALTLSMSTGQWLMSQGWRG